jgi:hypothetical protein
MNVAAETAAVRLLSEIAPHNEIEDYKPHGVAVLQYNCKFLDLEITTRNNFKIGGRPYSVQNAEVEMNLEKVFKYALAFAYHLFEDVECILGFKYKDQRRYLVMGRNAYEISVMIWNPHWLTAPEGCETNNGCIYKIIEVVEE